MDTLRILLKHSGSSGKITGFGSSQLDQFSVLLSSMHLVLLSQNMQAQLKDQLLILVEH